MARASGIAVTSVGIGMRDATAMKASPSLRCTGYRSGIGKRKRWSAVVHSANPPSSWAPVKPAPGQRLSPPARQRRLTPQIQPIQATPVRAHRTPRGIGTAVPHHPDHLVARDDRPSRLGDRALSELDVPGAETAGEDLEEEPARSRLRPLALLEAERLADRAATTVVRSRSATPVPGGATAHLP